MEQSSEGEHGGTDDEVIEVFSEFLFWNAV